MEKKEIINKAFNSIGLVIFIGMVLLLKTFLFYNNTIAVNEGVELFPTGSGFKWGKFSTGSEVE